MPDLIAEALAAQARETGEDVRLLEFRRLAAELYASGVDVSADAGQVTVGRQPASEREIALDFGKEHIRLGLVSDTHGGSKFEQLTALSRFYAEAIDAGVDAFVHAGDWTQGSVKMHRDQYLGLHAFSAEAQVAYVAAVYPHAPVPTYGIGGNHDDSFLADGGANVVRQIAARRDDIVYAGQDAAYLSVGGLRMYVQHPDGGGAYAKSYKPQRLSEALPIDKGVALHLIGHYHNWGLFRQQRTQVVMLPCFQGQYSWLARKGLHPDVGGVILDLWLDDDGYAAQMSVTPRFYATLEDDWNRDASHAADPTWSSAGIVR